MGIFLDTVEDNDEQAGWRGEAIRLKLGILPTNSRQFPSVKCPICFHFFFSNKELNDHVFSEHRDEYWFEKSSRHLELDLDRRKECDQHSLSLIDKEIASIQFKIDNNDRSVDSFWRQNKASFRESYTERYRMGFFEYLRAHDLEVNRHIVDHSFLSLHLETAYEYLNGFSTLLAQHTRRAIAFKMNWFKGHTEVPESSIFFLAWHFFTCTYDEVSTINDLPIISKRYQQGILLDKFHSKLLNAIQIYYTNRSLLDYNYLQEIEQSLNGVENRNYTDKFKLFQARLCRERNQFEQAKSSYFSIKNHPNFAREAIAFNG